MSSSKEVTCKGTLRQLFICLRPMHTLPLLHTVYTCIQYIYSYREGGGGGRGELRQREVYKGNSLQAGSKIPTWPTVSPVHKTPATKSLYRSIFRWRHFALPSMSLIFLRSDESTLMPPLERLIFITGALNVSMNPFLQRFRKMLTKIWEYCICSDKTE
jgi:hypothetical protein